MVIFDNCPPMDAVVLHQMKLYKTDVCPSCEIGLKIGDRYTKITRHRGRTGNYHTECYNRMLY